MTDNYPPNSGYPAPPEGYGQAAPHTPAYTAAQPGTPMPLYDPAQAVAPSPAPMAAPQAIPYPANQAAPMPVPQQAAPMAAPAYGAAAFSSPAAPQQFTPQGVPASVATMGDRFLARLIDGFVIGALTWVVAIFASLAGFAIMASTVSTDPATGEPNTASLFSGLLVTAAIVAIPFVLYEVLCLGLAGATLGKKAMGIKVVDATTGGRIGVGRAFLRYLIPVLGACVFLIGSLIVFLSPFWDGENRNRGWHDKAANDIVLKVRS